jgi:hypothetical protein
VKANWFAINRSIVANALFVKRPLWGWAWVHILTRTSYKTEQVCLTEVYRELSEHFTYSQWRHMVGVFVKEGMLEISETVNLGDKAGHRQMASVLNWSKYQKTAQSEQQSERRASDSASAERNNVQNGENDTSAQSERRASDSASAERAAVSIKNIQQEKEKRPSEARDPESEKAYGEVAYAAGHNVAEWLRDKRNFDFVRAVALWGDQLEDLWTAAVHADSRKLGDKAKFRFQDACEGDLDLGVKPPPGGVNGSAAPPAVEYGDVVCHPEHGEWLVDRIDPIAQKCEQSEKYFWVPMSEVTVVRRRSDCYA